MPSRLKDLRLRFPYDDQDFREKYTPGHVSPSSLKYTGDESKGPRAANASMKNNLDDTKEDKHSDVQLDLLSISRLFFSRFSILNVGSVLSKSFLV